MLQSNDHSLLIDFQILDGSANFFLVTTSVIEKVETTL